MSGARGGPAVLGIARPRGSWGLRGPQALEKRRPEMEGGREPSLLLTDFARSLHTPTPPRRCDL